MKLRHSQSTQWEGWSPKSVGAANWRDHLTSVILWRRNSDLQHIGFQDSFKNHQTGRRLSNISHWPIYRQPADVVLYVKARRWSICLPGFVETCRVAGVWSITNHKSCVVEVGRWSRLSSSTMQFTNNTRFLPSISELRLVLAFPFRRYRQQILQE